MEFETIRYINFAFGDQIRSVLANLATILYWLPVGGLFWLIIKATKGVRK